MKRVATIAICLLLIGVVLFVYLFNYHPVVLKTFVGTTRVLSPPMNCSIRVEGEEIPGAKCFAMKAYWDSTPADSVVLWIPESSNYYGRAIFLVDRKQPFVGRPNSSSADYYLLWGRYLFQSESGSFSTAFNKGGDYEDPQLEVTENRIKFRVHSAVSDFPGKHIDVDFR